MSEVVIRPASLADLETLLAFEQAIIEAERPFDANMRSGPDVRYYDLSALITSSNSLLLIAEIDSKVVGSGYARIQDSKTYLKHSRHSYLGFMYVVPEHRGKGLVLKIIAALEEWSVSQGVTEMQLEVYVENTAAIKAYEKSGYNASIATMRKELSQKYKGA